MRYLVNNSQYQDVTFMVEGKPVYLYTHPTHPSHPFHPSHPHFSPSFLTLTLPLRLPSFEYYLIVLAMLGAVCSARDPTTSARCSRSPAGKRALPQLFKSLVSSFVLLCFVLFCFVLFCFVLFCFVLFCFVLLCFYLSC